MLYWRTDPEHYIDAAVVASFLRELLLRLRGRVIVTWDGWGNHKGPAIREVTDPFPRLALGRLRGYALDLNPVEMIWSYLKYRLMANFVPRHVRHVDLAVRANLRGAATAPGLIKSLWDGSRPPFLDKNLAT